MRRANRIRFNRVIKARRQAQYMPDSESVVVYVDRMSHAVDLPSYQTPGAAGFDLHAAIEEDSQGFECVVLQPGQWDLIPTGLRMAIPGGYELQIRPRSGLAYKEGLTILNTPGTIDSDYRGEIKIMAINLGKKNVIINRGDRIAQGVLNKVPKADFHEASILTVTKRGTGGFGHTGTN